MGLTITFRGSAPLVLRAATQGGFGAAPDAMPRAPMSTQNDPATQLATLRALRATVSDPAQGAALDELIASLESVPPRDHTQTIGDNAQVDVAVAGDVRGDVQSGGARYQALLQVFFQAAGVAQPADEQRELLSSYLDTLARRCNRLRLTGVVDWERKHGKPPAFTLNQVYVALASTLWET